MMENDTYKTIAGPSPEVLYKDRGSKFFGYAYPIVSEEEVKFHLENLKKVHFNARHWCYAWQLGVYYEHYRANDDGEPSNSAGMPIYGQLQSFEVTQCLVVVVRYFGGTKLGVGGLMQAYKTAAQMALAAAEMIQKTINDTFVVHFEYSEMNTVMRIIKEEKIEIEDQTLEMNCEFKINVRKNESERIFELFSNTYKVKIKKFEA